MIRPGESKPRRSCPAGRKRAGKTLRGRAGRRSAPVPAAVRAKVRELEARQVELEAQNRKLRQARRQLEASRARYADLYDGAPVGYVSLDARGTIREMNAVAARMLGKERPRLLGRGLAGFVCEQDRGALREHVTRCLQRQPAPPCEVRLADRGHGPVPVEVRSLVARDREKGTIRCRTTLTDISERRVAQERMIVYQRRLRSLGARLAQAEEAERRRIAADLHDSVVQTLVTAKMQVQQLEVEAQAAQASAALGRIRELMERAMSESRSLLFDLSPPPLYELGLEAAIEWLAEKVQAEQGLPVTFEDDGQPKPLAEDVRAVLYRALRELLQNVIKHAHAKSVRIAARVAEERVVVEVADDGVGFDPDAVQWQKDTHAGFGLFHVRERLDYLGGSFGVFSQPGNGTRATLVVPLGEPRRGD